MKSHRQFVRRLRRLAIGLVAIGALVSVSAASALGDPGSSPSANLAAKVGDTPADFPGASGAPAVALSAASKVGDTPADFPGAGGAPGVALNAATQGRRHAGRLPRRQPRARRRAADDPGRPARAHRRARRQRGRCRSRSPAPRCSSCSWAPRSSSSACAWSAATRSGARTDLLKGPEVGRVDAAHLLGQCGGQRVEVGDLDEVVAVGRPRLAGAVEPDRAQAGRDRAVDVVGAGCRRP